MRNGRHTRKTAWKQNRFSKEGKLAGNNREDNRREYNQTVKHITYDRRQVNHHRSPYNQRDTRHLRQNNNGRIERSPNRIQVNPQVSEFHPSARSSRPVNSRTDEYERQRVTSFWKTRC
jgi:hypothetical protein